MIVNKCSDFEFVRLDSMSNWLWLSFFLMYHKIHVRRNQKISSVYFHLDFIVCF